jgi:UMF1 family MFS transporter
MSFEEDGRNQTSLHQRKRYLEEDTSPTTSRELNGWYSYAIAAEVFAVVGAGEFFCCSDLRGKLQVC